MQRMIIPEFNELGVLPESIYEMTLDEVKEYFCFIGNKEHRQTLFNSLLKYIAEVQKHSVDIEIYIDGSFVTNKEFPSDIDVLLFYDFEYNNRQWLDLISDLTVRHAFKGIQVLPGFLESYGRNVTIDFAHDIKDMPGCRKGIIKVIL